jgi:hypothetical protein
MKFLEATRFLVGWQLQTRQLEAGKLLSHVMQLEVQNLKVADQASLPEIFKAK